MAGPQGPCGKGDPRRPLSAGAGTGQAGPQGRADARPSGDAPPSLSRPRPPTAHPGTYPRRRDRSARRAGRGPHDSRLARPGRGGIGPLRRDQTGDGIVRRSNPDCDCADHGRGGRRRPSAGRRPAAPSLPESLHADFDRIVLAFQQAEAGKDDDARATLQGIGLRSPFLEWKLLLRGLQAYYANDDARALENWQRLAPDRLPARLAAPFRFSIDAEFRAAQPPETQTALQRQLDRVEGGESLAAAVASDCAASLTKQRLARRRLSPGRGAVAGPAPEAPQLVESGSPPVSTGPPSTPGRTTCFATSASSAGRPTTQASSAWRRWPTSAAATPKKPMRTGKSTRKRSPPTPRPGRRARPSACGRSIWLHMGRNAAAIPDDEEMAKLPAFLRDHPDRPQPLNPSAEQCYRRALELAPDLLEAHEGLVQLHLRARRNGKAEKAARQTVGTIPRPFADSRNVERPAPGEGRSTTRRWSCCNGPGRPIRSTANCGRRSRRPTCSPPAATPWPTVSTRPGASTRRR